ncbi:hypothetical protein B0A52_09967 [Exophiala mesophila]|uniref:Mannosyltransferase n=1 Tax=Exophiala mesophila TaxID=212818 RepID=A0A438MTZ8_EXOME|nr:hypothetical protein B0A52_09967 [Exophiala mesophila]
MVKLEGWHLCYVIFPLSILIHLYISPYTKVEESFNIQATHDILTFGVPTKNVHLRLKAQYDHMTFPGAVPRTFVGALILASIARPFVWLANLNDQEQQFLVRALLGFFNSFALIVYTSGVRQSFGKAAAKWFVFLQASQFHIMYYSSRTLPNMFAFGISTVALRFFLPSPTSTMSPTKRTRLALYLLTLATVVFRSELALLLAAHAIYILIRSSTIANAVSLVRTTFIPAIAAAMVVGLCLTVSIDTFFWQSKSLLWPELASFVSNIFPSDHGLGASAWGTSPWHWYFTSAIPRLVLNPLLLLLIPYSMTMPVASSVAHSLTPSLIYIVLYSFLPHKETRFLFPIVPPLTASIAIIVGHITTRNPQSDARKPVSAMTSTVNTLVSDILVSSTVLTALVSHLVVLPLSAQTYPGGHAVSLLHTSVQHQEPTIGQPQIHVHLSNLALQTGVTHFLTPAYPFQQTSSSRSLLTMPGSADGSKPPLTFPAPMRRTRWIYDKTDDETSFHTPAFWNQFDYVVVEDPALAIGAWDVVSSVPGLGKMRLLAPDVGRGLLVFDGSQGDDKTKSSRGDDGLAMLVAELYGQGPKYLYGIVHDLLREGYGLPSPFSWTSGWWLHCSLEPKLYILKKSQSGIKPA